MKRLLLLTLTVSIFCIGSLQAQTFIWAKGITGTSSQVPKDVVVDSNGMSYACGWSIGNTTFGSTTISGNSYDGWVVKHDANGNVEWAKSITGSLYQSAFQIDRDAYDGVYVAGWFYGNITIGDTSLTGTTSDYDAYIVKFDTNGNFKWVKTMTGSGITKPVGLAADDDGDVYVQLGFLGSFTAGSSSLSATGTTGWSNALVKYDSAGNYEWKTRIGGYLYIDNSWYWDYGGGVDIDGSGNPYCVGTFHSNDTLTVGSLTLIPSGWDAYMIKFNQNNGNPSWARKGGGTSTDYGTGIVIDDDNRIFMAGYNWSSNAAFGTQSITSSGPYWVRYNTSGTSVASQGGAGLCYSNEIAVDNEGHLYMAGLMYPNINLTWGSQSVSNSSSSSYTPYFYKYNYLDSEIDYLVKPDASGGLNYTISLDANTEDVVVAHGHYFVSVQFGSTTLTGTGYDGYLTRIANCEKLVAVATAVGGDSICDGEDVTLVADTNSLYDYQWLYNGAAITGEINSSYTTGTAGNYSVIVDSIGCVDTSDVITITVNSLPTVTHSNLGSVCDGDDPFTLSGGTPSGGTYSGTGVTSGGTMFDPGAAATGNNILTYTYTDANGCADSVDKTITVQTSPAIFTTTISACENDSPISLAGSAYGFPTGGTHSGTGVSGTSFNPTTAGAGTHTIYYESSNGCESPDSITATVNAAPNVNLDTFPDKCVTASGFALTGGTPTGGTYSGLGVFGAFYYPAFAGTGTHNIIYTVSSSGCSAADTSTITVDPTATSSISTLPELCEDEDTLLLTSYGSPAGGNFSGTGVSSNIFDPSVSGTGSFTLTYTFTNACGTATDTETMTVNDLPSISISSSNVSCNGGTDGSATATGSGTSSPYSYAWSTGASTATATGLSAGTYTVTVTDNDGCDDTSSVTITEPTALTALTSANNTSCNGGNDGLASAFGSGGTTSYTYAWSSGGTSSIITGLTAGSYTVTITDANGCTATSTATVSEPSAVVASISGTNISCNGGNDGAATASATGGTGTKTFAWSTGSSSASISSLTAGTYTVTATDGNGCTDTESVTITEPSAATASISVDENVSCFGGNDGELTASTTGGTAAYTYAWSNGDTTATITGLSAGTYTVTSTDANGCTVTASETVTQPSTPVNVTIGTPTNVSCNGGNDGSATASGSGGTGTITYAWSGGGGSSATASGLTAGTYTVTATDANGCTDTASVTITEPTTLVATASLDQDVSCNGGNDGEATASASGGTATYTYSWNTGGTSATITGLTAGTYTVTVTDANGCTDTDTVGVDEPAALIATTSVDSNVSCNGGNDGAATASASGGTATYTYSWNTGSSSASITGLTAGTYTVTVTDANGCTDTETVSITEPAMLVASVTLDSNVSCNGGNDGGATASATGGTTAYSYAWSSGGSNAVVTGLTAGTYTVTVTDANGCSDTSSVTITEPTAVSVTIGTPTNVSCNGGNDGSATASGSGGTGTITYAWSGGGGSSATASGLTAGTYTVTATDANGCTDTASVTITEPTTLVATASLDQDVSCNGGNDGEATASASGGTATYTYSWNTGGTSATITGLTAGTYTVTVTDANGCTDTDTVGVDEPATLVLAMSLEDSVSCFGGNDGSVSVSASGGTATYTYSWSSGGTTSTISGLTAGLYTVTVTDANGCTNSDTISVLEPDVLIVSIDSSTNVSCNGGNDGTATASGSGGTTNYAYSWSTGGTSSTATGLTAGCYTVTITDANGCTDTETVCITEPTVLVATASIDSNTSCSSTSTGVASVVASGGTAGYVYAWSSGSVSDTANSLSSGWHYVTVTDTNGCTAIDSVEIDVQDTVNPTVIAQTLVAYLDINGQATISADSVDSASFDNCAIDTVYVSSTDFDCSNVGVNTITLTVIDVNGNLDSTTTTITVVDTIAPFAGALDTIVYLDSFGMVTFAANEVDSSTFDACGIDSLYMSQSVFTCDDLGVNVVSFFAVDVNGNIDSTTLNVTVLDSLNAVSINIDSNLLCFGSSSGQLTATASGMTGAYSYAWSNSGTGTTISNLVEGTYTVTATSAGGCQAIDSVTLTEPDSLYAVLNLSDISCFGAGDGYATVDAVGGTPGYYYNWSNSSTLDSISGLIAGTYTVTVTDTNGCLVVDSGVVDEPLALLASIAFEDSSLCTGDTSGLAIALVSGGVIPYSYAWSGYSSTNDSLTNIGSGTYMLMVTDSNGCIAADTQTISEDTIPNVSLNIPTDSICQFVSVGLSGQTPLGGLFSGVGVVGDTLVTDSLTDWNMVYYAFTDSNGCMGEASDSIYVIPSPMISFSMNPVELCGGSEITLDFGSPIGGTYSGDPLIIDTANQLLTAPDSNYVGMGTYSFTNVCGSDTADFDIIIHETPKVDLGDDVVLCNASTIDFDAGVHASYEWFDASSNQTLTLNDGETPLEEDLNVWVVVSDSFGCSGSDTVFVDVQDQPTFYLGENIEACLKDVVTLTVPNVYDNFVWNTGDSTLSIVAHDGSVITPGAYEFYVTGSNDVGDCSYSDTIMVTLEDCDSSFVGVNEIDELDLSFEIFPNPTRDVLNIQGNLPQGSSMHRIVLIGMQGEVAKIYGPSDWSIIASQGVQLDLSKLADGVYMLRLEHDFGVNNARVIVGK